MRRPSDSDLKSFNAGRSGHTANDEAILEPLLAELAIRRLAEVFDEMVDERSHFRRQMAAARVRDVDLDLRQPIVGKQPHQGSARRVVADQIARQDRDAHAEQRELPQHFGVVRDDDIRRPHVYLAFRAGEHALVAPVFRRQAQARMREQISGRVGVPCVSR